MAYRRGMRMLSLGAAFFALSLVAAAVVLSPRPERAPGVTTPSFVGFTRTQVFCSRRALTMPVRLDDERPRRLPAALCHGRAIVFPDPRVIRQVPAPGAPLRTGETVRLYTDCHRVGCL